MKNKIFTIAGILLGVLLSTLLYNACNHHTVAKEDKAIQKLETIRYVDTTSHYRDDYNREHAQHIQAEGSLQQLKAVYQDVLTAKAKELHTSEKNITSVTGFNVVHHDTILIPVGQWPIHSTYKGLQHDTTIYLSTKDSLSIVQYTKRTGWFKRTPYIDVLSYTQGASVTDIQGFRVSNGTTSWLSIGPSGALIYTSNKQFIPAAGVGAFFKVWKVPVSISILKAFN
jgi:hypothetical protein